jgi:RNase adaptor protein for sRNA GlmZ degradation
LDVIDRLRSLGVSRYIDLPQIIVYGNQSAGKSSVLEAISGLLFPTKDNLCTRFATKLILRRDGSPGMQVAIIPSPVRTPYESELLSKFRYEIKTSKPDLEIIIEEAKLAIGLSNVKIFSNNILRVELRGPN